MLMVFRLFEWLVLFSGQGLRVRVELARAGGKRGTAAKVRVAWGETRD